MELDIKNRINMYKSAGDHVPSCEFRDFLIKLSLIKRFSRGYIKITSLLRTANASYAKNENK